MRESEVRRILEDKLGSFNYRTDKLTTYINEHKIDLKGYLTWLIETKGPRNLKQHLVSEQNVLKYAQTVSTERFSLPRLIVNAGELYKKLAESNVLQDSVISKLETMTQPYILYFLFVGSPRSVDKYRAAARRYTQTYPQVVLSLPEPYCSLGKAFLS